MKRIKYITYYDTLDSKIERNYVLSSTNKVDYIISVLNRIGYAVDIISFSEVTEKKFFTKGSKKDIGDNTLKLFSSFGKSRYGIFRFLNRKFMSLLVIIWLLVHIHRDEQIIVYHSLGYCRLLNFIKQIKRIQIIGEIEEIYQDVSPQKANISDGEYRFISNCSKYIFPSRLLDEKINERHKPSVIVHGVYSVENKTFNPFNDGRIHVVYAGTFDPNKGGARASILSSKYLSEKFHLHILGFGNHSQLQMVNDLINQVQSQTDCVITNDGLLKGSEFTAFLQKCQIGLSTQDPNAIFNDTSFPSKILTYLANGLKVVSADMNVVRTSQVVDGLFFYSRQEPELIANAIIDASKARNIDISDLMRKLDKQFYSNLYKLLAE